MAKLTSSSAVTPPNTQLTLLSWSTGSGTGTLISGAFFERLDFLLHPARSHRAARRQDALRPIDRQNDQSSPEQQYAPLLETAEPLRQVGDDRRTYHHAIAVALATHHDRGDEEDGEQQQEGLRADETLTTGEQCAGKPSDEGSHGERQQLELESRYAHQLCGVLVLPGRLPRSANPAVLDQCVADQHHDDHGEGKPVIGNQVENTEPQEDRGLPQVDERHSGIPIEVRDLEELDARRPVDLRNASGRAQPRGIDQGKPNDLAEAERDDGQIVTTHPQCWRAQR